MKKFLLLTLYMYLGSVASCTSLLLFAGIWEHRTSFWQALPGAFLIQITLGLPWYSGTLLGSYLFTRRDKNVTK